MNLAYSFVFAVQMAGWALAILLGIVLRRGLRKYRRLRLDYRRMLKEKEVMFGFVHDVGEIFAESDTVEIDALLVKVLTYAMQTTHAGAGAIYLLEPDHQTLRARAVSGLFPPLGGGPDAGVDPAISKVQQVNRLVRSRLLRKGEGILGDVADFGTPIRIEDAERDPRIPHFGIDFLRVRSLLAVPMRFHHRTLGVLAVVNRTDGNPFIEADESLLQALADQASVSTYYARMREDLDDKKRLDHDLSIARRIQTLLLPGDIPHVPGFEIAAFNIPALMVGGDYYDVIHVDDDHIGIAIADVSGKGIGGALVMSVCRSTLRARAPGQLSPAHVLRDLSRELAHDLAEDMFVTAGYFVLNHRTRELRYARAGHEPLVLCRNAHIEEMEPSGIAIGMQPPDVFDEILKEHNRTLQAGDVLLAYTDGITEAMNQGGEEWGAERLYDVVRTAAEGSAQQVIETIRGHLTRHTGEAPPYDDMTLVALKVNAVPPR